MKYARIVNNTAVDVRTESPEGFFAPEVVAEFVAIPDQVEDGWGFINGNWIAPVIPEPIKPQPQKVDPPKISPVEFKLLFTSQERIAIKANTDPVIQDFFEIVNDPRLTCVDLGLQSTKDAIGYLQFKQLLTAKRSAEILLGKLS